MTELKNQLAIHQQEVIVNLLKLKIINETYMGP